MQLFAGSTNLLLANKIAANLGVRVGAMELSQFPNGECRVFIKEKLVDEEAIVVQSFAGDPNRAIMEFCLLVDALRRMKVKDITAVIPWLGYSIQDKIFREGEPLSARVVVNMIESTKVSKVITVDLHNQAIEGFFSIPVRQLSALKMFVTYFERQKDFDVVLAPDLGALKKATQVAHTFNCSLVVINKRRDLNSGKLAIVSLEGEVSGKKILIVDDFVSTGGTLVQTASYLKKNKARKVTVAVTHFLNLPGVLEKLSKSGIDELYVTDTIEVSENDLKKVKKSDFKVEILSVAEMIVREIKA